MVDILRQSRRWEKMVEPALTFDCRWMWLAGAWNLASWSLFLLGEV